jgi:aminoglycoside phosphotransferase (APT) family kinase protein
VEKADITPELVARLLAAQFSTWAHLPVRPVERDGWDNTTFRVGDDLSARLPSADAYVLQIEKEHRWLPRLAPELPLPIPTPVALGAPSEEFPRPWSLYRWLPGRHAALDRIVDTVRMADDLGGFLHALYRVEPDGPPWGAHSFNRGGPLDRWDAQVRAAVSALRSRISETQVTALWERCLAQEPAGPPVWVHGDVAATNLLVVDDRLSAVIDFGCCAVGDPACDMTIAWTLSAGPSPWTMRRGSAGAGGRCGRR